MVNIAAIKPTTLKQPLTSDAVQIIVRAFVDRHGNPPSWADLNTDWIVLIVKQGDTWEQIKCDNLVQNDDDSCTFDIATNGRKILPIYPFTGSSEGFSFQSAVAEVVVGNDMLTMTNYPSKETENTWSETQIFAVVPQSLEDPVANNDLTRKSYVDALVLGTLTTINVIVPAKAGATIAIGNSVYFDETSNKWKLTDADTASTVNDVLLGIAQGSGTDGNPILNGVLLQGVDENQSGMSEGDVQYASNTPGGIVNTPGTTVVTLGIAKSATDLYFNPRFNQQLTQAEKTLISQLAVSMSGMIAPFGRASVPTGWLACDGSAVSRTTYSALFTAIGIGFGAGDGSITFNVPNLKGKVPVGLDGAQTEFDVLGETGGEKTHVLITAEIPAHTHVAPQGGGLAGSGWSTASTVRQPDYSGNIPTGSTGGDGAHNNLQPYLVINYYIKT